MFILIFVFSFHILFFFQIVFKIFLFIHNRHVSEYDKTTGITKSLKTNFIIKLAFSVVKLYTVLQNLIFGIKFKIHEANKRNLYQFHVLPIPFDSFSFRVAISFVISQSPVSTRIERIVY